MKEVSNLAIQNFPPELAERIFADSGEKVLTRGVISCLYKYFELKSQYQSMKLKAQDLQSDLDQVITFFRLEDSVKKKRSELLKLLGDPNRFYLHGD